MYQQDFLERSVVTLALPPLAAAIVNLVVFVFLVRRTDAWLNPESIQSSCRWVRKKPSPLRTFFVFYGIASFFWFAVPPLLSFVSVDLCGRLARPLE